MNDNNKTIVSPASVEHLQDQNFTRTTFENLIPMRFDQMKKLNCQVSCTHIISEARFSMQKRFVGNIQQFKDIATLAQIYIQI